MLLRPLFFTSYLIDDFLARQRVLRRSHDRALERLQQDRERARLPALAPLGDRCDRAHLRSAALEFARGLGVYDHVLPYERARHAARGARGLRRHGRRRRGAQRRARSTTASELAHSAVVGATHHDQMGAVPESLPGPRPTFFFAPDRVTKRTADWGREGFEERTSPRRGIPTSSGPTAGCRSSTGSGTEALRERLSRSARRRASTPPRRTCSRC